METDQQGAPQATDRRTAQPWQAAGKRTAQSPAQILANATDRNDSSTTQPDIDRSDRRTTKALAKDKPQPSHQDEIDANDGMD